MIFRKLLKTLVLLLAIPLSGFSQDEECALILSKAQKMYDAGVIEQIPQMLQPCLNKGFTTEESMQAYKLIISSYLFDGNKAKAEETMLLFLDKNPEYEVTSTDPAEFVQLFESFQTLPISSIGITAGINISNVQITESHGTYNLNEEKGSYSSNGIGLKAGIAYSRLLISNLYGNIEGNFVQNKFKYSNSLFGQTITETHNCIEIPLSLTYNFSYRKRILPFLRLGIGGSYLLNATSNGQRQTSVESLKQVTGADYSKTSQRNAINAMAIFGGGVKFRIKGGQFMLDVRYNLGLTQQNNKNERYSNTEEVFHYYYIDNNFKINNFCISVGYAKTFFEPKKK